MRSCLLHTLFIITSASALAPQNRRQVLQTAAQTAAAWSLLGKESFGATDPSFLDITLPKGATLAVPRVGYSLYQTSADQVETGVRLALAAGVRHFETASQYGTADKVGKIIQEYIKDGPDPGTTRQQRREKLFLSHKISNEEQSKDRKAVQTAVQKQFSFLKEEIDLVMIHSPLTDQVRRLKTYEALLDLQAKGVVKAVGVCNYGLNPLNEIVDAGLPPPSVIQLALSPFNQHTNITAWAKDHGSTMSCSAWSKLSSAQGPQKGWATLEKIAKKRGMTKAQVLVRWAVQSGYLCVPRSGSKFAVERKAIQENSWIGTSPFVLSEKEMKILNKLDEQLPAGQLGITDGWDASAIVDATWDPTLAV